MWRVYGLILLIFAGFRPAQAAAAREKSRPNVVLITIDTLRADHLGCYGYQQVRTPNIDSLAIDSFRFTRAFTPVPVTLPAHSSMLTGTYPMLSGMHDFAANKLSPQQPTLATVLKEAGYTTGAVVASAVLDSRFGLNQGFDFYYDHFDFSRLDETNLDAMERPGNVVTDVALDWLRKNLQKKFLLWMHLYDPHHPYQPPAPYDREYASRPYDGEIAFVDEQVGRLLRFLKKNELYSNTVIVLAGDHGESLGEHGEKTHGFFIYNSTLHVPLLIHLSGKPAAGTIGDPVSLVDLTPTILSAVGLQAQGQGQGRNLIPAMRGEHSETDRNLYSETFLPRIHFNWSELRGAQNARYHFIDAPKPELYDLTKDPGELRNLFLEKKAVGEEMRAKLAGLIREYSAGKELAEKTGLDPALMERLKSLGYAGFSGGGGDPTISNRELPDPKDRVQVYELISEALSQSQHGQYQQSTQNLNIALKTEPNSVAVNYLLGLNHYRTQDYPKAIQHLQLVVQLSPDYALAFFNLGLAYARTGAADDAMKAFRRTLELDPSNFTAAYDLGLIYSQKGMANEAAAAFRQSATVAPSYAQAHRGLGEVLLYQGNVDEALTELRRAAELSPQDPVTRTSLAKALAAKGLNEEADQEMRKAEQMQRR